MVQKTETIKGTINRFLFQSQENGFAIAIINSSQQKDDIIAKGYLPDLQAGQEVSLSGNWIFHPKFGKQFEVQKYQITLPTSLAGLKKYLGSGLIKGIGKVYADKLVKHFGEKILSIIEEHPQRLHEVEGVGTKRIAQITASWQQQKDVSNIMIFLQDKDISSSYAIKIYKKYGQSSVAVLQENPYRLADEIWGIGFKVADQIASKLGIPFDSQKRIKSGINFAITTAIGKGHLYIEVEELKNNTYEILGLSKSEHASKVKHAFHDLYNEEVIKVIKNDGNHFVTLAQYLFTEKLIAKKVNLLLETQPTNNFDFDKIYLELRTNSGPVQLNDDQQMAIMSALKNKVTVITGGPGTGKTTLIKQLLAILDNNNTQYKLAAPTGRAAKRISESTGKFAATIHRLLEFDVSTMKFVHNDQNTLKMQFLILDEASMIDTFLINSILKAMPLYAHLILIGDIDQLPSVGPGNVLNDFIKSDHVPYIKLTEIFRQAQDSLIVTNAHKVNQGEFPSSRATDSNKKDFIFIKEDNPEMLPTHFEKIFKGVLARHRIFPSQTVILSPMHRGSAGTQKINFDVQKILNSESIGKSVSHGGYEYKIGDRIMQLKNNYDKNVFNGDIGQITEINHTDKTIICKYDSRIVPYDFTELDELTLAYAISIHKSQGSEYDAVIIPIFTQHFTLLQRNLIYTAITRAKKLCILIGQTKAIAMAVKNNKTTKRKTFLKELLTTELDVI
jgi:exodeoxyribonuclease V alpha subunit